MVGRGSLICISTTQSIILLTRNKRRWFFMLKDMSSVGKTEYVCRIFTSHLHEVLLDCFQINIIATFSVKAKTNVYQDHISSTLLYSLHCLTSRSDHAIFSMIFFPILCLRLSAI